MNQFTFRPLPISFHSFQAKFSFRTRDYVFDIAMFTQCCGFARETECKAFSGDAIELGAEEMT